MPKVLPELVKLHRMLEYSARLTLATSHTLCTALDHSLSCMPVGAGALCMTHEANPTVLVIKISSMPGLILHLNRQSYLRTVGR